METTIGYIVIFGLGLVFAVFYLFGKKKQRLLPIAQENYPQVRITVLITKEKRKVTALILELFPVKQNLTLNRIELELADPERRKKIINLNPFLSSGKTQELIPGKKMQYLLEMDDFLKISETAGFPYETFRLVAVNAQNKKFKSHLLAYHPRWGIFKADSGKYN
jgi:hypothetical protein